MSRTAKPESIRLSILIAYAAPGLPLAVATLPVYIFIPTLYGQEFGISLSLIGTVLLVVRLIDAISDPLIGSLSDHTTSRFGRRKPWLVAAMPFMLFSIYKLFVPPSEVDAFYLGLWSLCLTLAWTAMILPYSAWAAELTGDYHGRTKLTSIREVFVLGGTIIAAGLPALLTSLGFPNLKFHAFAIALFILATLPVTVFVCALRVPDKKPARPKKIPWRRSLTLLQNNRPFRQLLLAYLINSTANGLPATLFILFVTHRLNMPDVYGLLLFVYFSAAFLAIPLWYHLSKRWGKHRTWCTAMTLAAFSFIWTPFMVGPGDFATFFVITLVSGIGVGADLVLPPSIQADVVDGDTLKSGAQRTGLFFALWGMATKLALGLSAGIAFPLLTLAGFDAGASKAGMENSEFSLFSLAMLYAFVPVLLKMGAITMMWNFPLSEVQQREVQTLLGQRKSI